jgi:hypothetical protein
VLFPAFKIASGDSNYFELLQKIAATGKPVMISTGLSDEKEKKALRKLFHSAWRSAGHGNPGLALLHCVTEYPTPDERAGLRYLEALGPIATEFQSQLASQDETLSFSYVQKDEGELAQQFALSRRADIQRGFTQIGPHRDDILAQIDGKEARLFGSQGQQRTTVIAVKLATLQTIKDILGATPVLLLDDILSDLDPDRRAKLCNVVFSVAEQAILTCTEATAAGQDILDRAEVLHMQGGKFL